MTRHLPIYLPKNDNWNLIKNLSHGEEKKVMIQMKMKMATMMVLILIMIMIMLLLNQDTMKMVHYDVGSVVKGCH